MTTFEKTVRALLMANPFVISSFFEELGCCREMSWGGALALQRSGLNARAIRCSIQIRASNKDSQIFVGMTQREAYQRDNARDALSFDKWKSQKPIGADGEPALHAAIEAEHMGQRVLIDLTFGQVLRNGLRVPLSLVNSFAQLPFDFHIQPSLTGTYYASQEELPPVPADVCDRIAVIYKALLDSAAHTDLSTKTFDEYLRNANPRGYHAGVELRSRFVPTSTEGIF